MGKLNNKIFVTGGTGYIGSNLIPRLLKNGYEVHALVRPGSENKLPSACRIISGNALDRNTFTDKIPPCETFIHLVGVSNPLPAKKNVFREVDLLSVQEASEAAKSSGIKHFIYLSVAEPAPIMKEYVKVRREGEQILRQSKLNATFLKPWYVLGPGHRWPYIFIPFYKLMELLPMTNNAAKRLALVNIKHMVNALIFAVENPANGIRMIRANQIKKL
jgi:nucleoside-diphosphate-sugar epimerase